MGRPNGKTGQRGVGDVLKVRKDNDGRVPVVGRRTRTSPVTFKCTGCNYRVPYPDTYCGECLCEEDGI